MKTSHISMVLLALALLTGCTAPIGESEEQVGHDAASANFKLGVLYMQAGRYTQAEFKLTRALEFDPDMESAYNALGVLYEQTKDLPRALENFQTAVEKKPDYTLAQLNYGRLLCRAGDYEQGEQQFLAVATNPDYTAPEIPYTGAGVCARARKNLEAADGYYRKALETNPRAAATLLELSSLSIERKRYKDARDILRRYHLQSGYNPTSLGLAIRVEDALGDEQASKKFRELLQARSKT